MSEVADAALLKELAAALPGFVKVCVCVCVCVCAFCSFFLFVFFLSFFLFFSASPSLLTGASPGYASATREGAAHVG